MRVQIFLLSFIFSAFALAEIQESPLDSGAPSYAENALEESNFPVAKGYKDQKSAPQFTSSKINSGFPAQRQVLESAAEKCSDELAQIWSQQNALEPYKRSHFQKCMGEASQRCKKLKQLAESMRLADEELFSYQQAVLDAQKVFQ